MNSDNILQCPVTVLLGAGASKDAGLLLATELLVELETRIQKSGEEPLKRALGLILGGIAFGHGSLGNRLDHQVDIESALRVAQQLADRSNHPLAHYVASWHTALERLDPSGDGVVFHRLIAYAKRILRELLTEPEDIRLKYLSGICDLGRPFGRSPAYPNIFTLNYDLCLEKALSYSNIQYTTGFRDGVWSTKEFVDTTRVHVYKLHGSFGWVRHPDTQLLYDRDKALGRDDVIFLSADTPDELIFGTDNKLQASQPFLWMFHQFAERVEQAKYIICIGYGFGDEHINKIIGQAMASQAGKRLLVVGPGVSPTDFDKINEMELYPERTSFLPHTAKDALQERDTILKELQKLQKELGEEEPFT